MTNADQNHGWILIGNEEGGTTVKRFESRENDAQHFRPAIEITYTGELLPVELTHFSGQVDGSQIRLHWETASETNNAGFEIQSLTPEGTPQILGFVEGKGSTLLPQSYQFVVTNPSAGFHRYRLKQIDFDGSFAYSPVVTLQVLSDKGPMHIEAFPNPFNPTATIEVLLDVDQQVTLGIFDLLGRQLTTLYAGHLSAHEVYVYSFDAGHLPSGMYMVRLASSKGVENKILVLEK